MLESREARSEEKAEKAALLEKQVAVQQEEDEVIRYYIRATHKFNKTALAPFQSTKSKHGRKMQGKFDPDRDLVKVLFSRMKLWEEYDTLRAMMILKEEDDIEDLGGLGISDSHEFDGNNKNLECCLQWIMGYTYESMRTHELASAYLLIQSEWMTMISTRQSEENPILFRESLAESNLVSACGYISF
ncbi:conserved hypothetical protein [Ricinus communis]|uniref:Uncharacterized protein n=1 Tax=Ricinus communis TaxID=3988 RepID=B9SVK6_RICCO|nr:conserved hypothetical protein [Ricinus communis]